MSKQADKNYDPRLVGALTDAGPSRPNNQDAFWTPDAATPTELGALYVVADGVGGQEHGAEAARMVTAVLSGAFYQARRQGQAISVALEQAVQQANEAVYHEAAQRQARMGSTVVAAVVESDNLYVAHVGDARAYLVAERKLRPLTRDDTWVQNQVDAGIITPEVAETHEFRNVVTQVLGNRLDINVHLLPPQRFPEDGVLLLCSDGLYDAVPPAQLYELLAQESAPVAASKLLAAAIAAEAGDNITAVVARRAPARPIGAATAAAAANKSAGVPAWLPVLILLVVVIVAGGLWWAWQAAQTPPPTDLAATTDVTGSDSPAVVAPVATEAEPVTATATIAIPATNTLPPATFTPPPTAVPTLTPTLTPTPTLTVTAGLEITPTLTITGTVSAEEPPAETATPPALACIRDDTDLAWLWSETAFTPTGCPSAVARGFLISGNPVYLVEGNSRTRIIPTDCVQTSNFIEVQSVERPELTGWVFLNQIRRLEPGQTCD